MDILKRLLMCTSVCLLLSSGSIAQQPANTGKSYDTVEVTNFTIRQGVEYPTDKIAGLTKSIVDTLRSSKRFDQVSIAADAAATDKTTDGQKLKITGEIIKYVKGSQAARYLVGFGAGKTKIIVDVKFVDIATGEVVHQQTVDGEVTWGLFGGSSDSAKSGVADEIIRVMKKNRMAGEKKRS